MTCQKEEQYRVSKGLAYSLHVCHTHWMSCRPCKCLVVIFGIFLCGDNAHLFLSIFSVWVFFVSALLYIQVWADVV